MSVERQIQIAVARADMIICSILRYLPLVVSLCIILLLAVIAFKRRASLDDRTDSGRIGGE